MRNVKLIGLFILIGISSSCNNDDDDDTGQILTGIFTETSPASGRSQLNFVDENTVVKTETGNPIEDEFDYELHGNTLKLTLTQDNTFTGEFIIMIENNSKFKIENLYPSIPEDETIYMTFEK